MNQMKNGLKAYTVRDGYVLFWGSPLSNWWPVDFEVEGVRYSSAEQFMMAEKAKLFNDGGSLAKIMATDDPRKQKSQGRLVTPFDHQAWNAVARDRLFVGVSAKYRQNKELQQSLLETGDLMLVEASPFDAVWGIGMDQKHPDATTPAKWKGTNWLGKVLMRVRTALRASAAAPAHTPVVAQTT